MIYILFYFVFLLLLLVAAVENKKEEAKKLEKKLFFRRLCHTYTFVGDFCFVFLENFLLFYIQFLINCFFRLLYLFYFYYCCCCCLNKVINKTVNQIPFRSFYHFSSLSKMQKYKCIHKRWLPKRNISALEKKRNEEK